MAPLAWVGEGVMFAWAASPARIAPAWQFAALGGAARLDKAGWARGGGSISHPTVGGSRRWVPAI